MHGDSLYSLLLHTAIPAEAGYGSEQFGILVVWDWVLCCTGVEPQIVKGGGGAWFVRECVGGYETELDECGDSQPVASVALPSCMPGTQFALLHPRHTCDTSSIFPCIPYTVARVEGSLPLAGDERSVTSLPQYTLGRP